MSDGVNFGTFTWTFCTDRLLSESIRTGCPLVGLYNARANQSLRDPPRVMPNQHGKYYNSAYKITYRTHRITVTKCLDCKTQHEQPLDDEIHSSRSVPEGWLGPWSEPLKANHNSVLLLSPPSKDSAQLLKWLQCSKGERIFFSSAIKEYKKQKMMCAIVSLLLTLDSCCTGLQCIHL